MSGNAQIALTVLGIILALRWGEWPERAAFLVLLGAHLLDRYYHWAIGGLGAYSRLDPGHLVIDLFMLAGLLAIALRADRQWTLWVAGAQVVALLAHPVRMLSGDLAAIAYAIMIRAPSWFQIAMAFVGIAAVNMRRSGNRRSAPRLRPWSVIERSRLPNG